MVSIFPTSGRGGGRAILGHTAAFIGYSLDAANKRNTNRNQRNKQMIMMIRTIK